MNKKRSILFARDKISGDIFDAKINFENSKKAHKIRFKYNNGDYDFECISCRQKLIVSTSKRGLVHFRHAKESSFCELKDENYSFKDITEIYNYIAAKESKRHFELKNLIGEKLKKDSEVCNVIIDKKYLTDGKQRGMPDVFCDFKNKKLVFEIQLSKLPLRYILKRHKLYKSLGYFLIWILDDFNVYGQSQTEKDIKHLTSSHNFFKLDETVDSFRLTCKYKYPYLVNDLKIISNWKTKSVGLRQLSFNEESKQVYFFDYNKEIILLKQKKETIEFKKISEWEKEKELHANHMSESIIEDIIKAKHKRTSNYDPIKRDLFLLDEYELKIFNEKLNLKKINGDPAIFRWVKNAKKEDLNFIHFLFDCEEIEFNVNEKNDKGETLLHFVLQNPYLEAKKYLLNPLLKRKYAITYNDKQDIKKCFKNKSDVEKIILQCELSMQVQDRFHVSDVFKYINLLSIIRSAETGVIIGFGFNSDAWIQFANNAIHNYKSLWPYIRKALEYYDVWNLILSLDKRNTFTKKLKELEKMNVSTDKECEYLLLELYPEIFYEMVATRLN